MNFFNGLHSILSLDIGDGFKPVACLLDTNLSESVEMLDTTTRDNAGWNTSTPTNQSFELSFSGIAINTLFGGDTTKYSYDILKFIKRNKTLFDWKITNIVNGDIDYGKGYLTSLNGTYNIDEFISFDGNIKGYGIPVTDNVTPIDTGLESLLEILT